MLHTSERWLEIGTRKLWVIERGRLRRRVMVEVRQLNRMGMALPTRHGVKFVRFRDSQRFRRD